MARSLLIRGMLVGLLAGLLMFGFGKVFGEPNVDIAIAFESAADAAKAQAARDEAIRDHKPPPIEAEDPDIFSRTTQAGIGLLTGLVVYATAMGGLFSLVFTYALGRIGSARPKVVSVFLAASGFVAVSVVPMIIYPANPPAIGEPETITYRTAIYFIMIAISVGAVVFGVVVRKSLLSRLDRWNATLAALGGYLIIIIAAAVIMPGINEVPSDFPAVVLWHFRVASMGLEFVLWSTLGVVFGLVAERKLLPQSYPAFGARLPAQ